MTIGAVYCQTCQTRIPVELAIRPIGEGYELRAQVVDGAPSAHRVRVSYQSKQFVRFRVDATSCRRAA